MLWSDSVIQNLCVFEMPLSELSAARPSLAVPAAPLCDSSGRLTSWGRSLTKESGLVAVHPRFRLHEKVFSPSLA